MRHAQESHPVRIFFCAGLSARWRSGWQRSRTLCELGCEVVEFCQEAWLARAANRRFRRWLTGKAFRPSVEAEFNRVLRTAIHRTQPDVAWLEWPKMVFPETLVWLRRELPRCCFVSFQDDNPFGDRTVEGSSWKTFLSAIPEYHLHFVKRPCDVVELKQRGARQVCLFMHGVFPNLFSPIPPITIPADRRHDVSFVGTPLDHRVRWVWQLMQRYRIPLHVYGNGWAHSPMFYFRRGQFHRAAVEAEYAQVICGSRVSLGFVSSSNRDEYTMRTFEIPGCKGFLLAERTPIHQELFTEGKEAEYFDSVDECADKIRFYLQRSCSRDRIAEAGYRRCIESDYSLRRRMSDAIREIETLTSHALVHF